jgi:fumarylpyruvate hydrolase
MTANFHHEIELVVTIAKGGKDIPVEQALDHVHGYAVGLDMTRRDLQLDARDKGRPWEFGKSFAQSAPIGPVHPATRVGHLSAAGISLTVNGQPRQSSDIAKLIWSVAESISYLSRYETLEPGDIIMTGTPEGVGAVTAGDVMRGHIDGLGDIIVRVAA